MEKINEYYEENNYPAASKLYKIMIKDGVKITLNQIKDFLNKQESEQVNKIQVEKHDGHIVAMFPNEFWQIDIFVLEKYEKYNKGYISFVLLIFLQEKFIA
jgi:hypothetical protein